jgi:hypothetical protein
LVATGCQTSAPAPRDYYFSPRGDDRAGTGSSDQPYRNIARANALHLNPGDRLLFEAGQTFAGNLLLDADDAGAPEQPVTVASFGAGRATIDAGAGTGVRAENAGGVRVADLVITGSGARANRGSGVEFVNTLGGGRTLSHVRIENVEARGFGREGIAVRGAPADRSPSGFDDVLIADCAARENAHTGIYLTGSWRAAPGRPPHAFAHANVRVVRCLAADNPGDPQAKGENRSGSGIMLDAVNGATIEYCQAFNNGAANRSRGGGPVGIWCTVSNRVTIQYCKSHHNRTGAGHDGGGFCLDGGVCNSVLQYNVSEGNDGSGFGLYEYPYAPPAFANVIRHNTSRDDGRKNGYAGIHVWDDAHVLRDVRIENNRVEISASTGADKPPRGLWLQSAIRDAVVANNTFVVAPGARVMDVAKGQRGVRFEHNVYEAGGDRIAVEWEGREFTSLRAWLAATGQSAAAQQAGAE